MYIDLNKCVGKCLLQKPTERCKLCRTSEWMRLIKPETDGEINANSAFKEQDKSHAPQDTNSGNTQDRLLARTNS